MMLDWARENFHPLWHLRRNSAAFRWITRNIRIPIGVHINDIDHPLYVDLLRNPHLMWSPNNYEREDLNLMVSLIGSLNLRRMFDVGANLGIYSFLFSANAVDGEVVAFEPDAVNAKLFEKTSARCPRRNIALERDAVAEAPGTATFLLDDMSGATGSLRLDAQTFSEQHYPDAVSRMTVTTTSIDKASERFFPPDFIKIDVEGAELNVLKGARQTLASARPILLIECNTEESTNSVQEFLDKFEYLVRPAAKPNYLAYHKDTKL
jgi:FkbM family methyltransferase